MKRNDSNCVGILTDQGEAAPDSHFSEFTIQKASIVNLYKTKRGKKSIMTTDHTPHNMYSSNIKNHHWILCKVLS